MLTVLLSQCQQFVTNNVVHLCCLSLQFLLPPHLPILVKNVAYLRQAAIPLDPDPDPQCLRPIKCLASNFLSGYKFTKNKKTPFMALYTI